MSSGPQRQDVTQGGPITPGVKPPRRGLFGRNRVDGLRLLVLGGGLVLGVLLPQVDALADADLTLHMFQHIGLFVGGLIFGYGLEIVIMAELPTLLKISKTAWRLLTTVMKANVSTKGIVFVVVIPTLAFAYWHIPGNFDLAVQNESVHVVEHLVYITVGIFAGVSVQAVSRKWRVVLLYVGFMSLGMMGSMWIVWRPGYFPIYSYAANMDMGTAMMLTGALGVVGTSSFLLKVMDII